jgi:hypothetical protein
MPRYRLTIVSCILLLLVSGASLLSAQTGGAMLYANGNVKVNGQAAGDSISVFPGDKIDVNASSAGSINRNGSSVVVNPNSSIQYQPASVEVLQGSARVSTSKGMTASAGQVTVSPKDSAAKFDIVRTDNKVVVVSREGALTVQDGSRTVIVQSGSSAELAVGPTAGASVAQDSGSKSSTVAFLSDRLSEHPFYGVTNGVSTKPDTLPICEDLLTCIRPGVSMIRPCCCPPRIMCN